MKKSHGWLDFDGVIVFNHIEVNEGGGLNEETGKFVTPVALARTYVFSFSALTASVHLLTLLYMVGLELRKDEKVYMEVIGGKLYNDPQGSFTHFTWQLDP